MAITTCRHCHREISSYDKRCSYCSKPTGSRKISRNILITGASIAGLLLLVSLLSPKPLPPVLLSRDTPDPQSAAPPAAGWKATRTISPMDDSPTLLLSVKADTPIHGWPDKEFTPELVVRCKERQMAIFVITGMEPEPEYGSYDEASVRLRLDRNPPEKDDWNKSTDDHALFISGGSIMAMGMLERFYGAKTLTFQFTPFHSDPATTTFHIDGLLKYNKELMADCPADRQKLDDE